MPVLRVIVGVCLLLCMTLPLVADRRPPQFAQRPPHMRQLMDRAHQLLSEGNFSQAYTLYTEGLKSPRLSDYDRCSLLIGTGNCYLAGRRFPEALRAYRSALDIAEPIGLVEHLLTIAGNRAMVYRQMGDFVSAREAVSGVDRLARRSRRPALVAQAAMARREVDLEGAIATYLVVLNQLQLRPDPGLEATVWNALGYAYLLRDELVEADRAFTEGFRLSVMAGRKNLQTGLYYLGLVRRRQGRPAVAVQLLQQALERTRGGGADGVPAAYVQHELALALLHSGRREEAVDAFEMAVRLTRDVRLQVLPSESFRVASESALQSLFRDYVRTGMELYAEGRGSRMAERMFEVAEDSRLALYQQGLIQSRTLPNEYWELLRKFRRSLARSLDPADLRAAQESAGYRLQLADFEARLGIGTEQSKISHQISERVRPGETLNGLRTKLKASEALLSFHVGDRVTYLWAVTSSSFEVHRLIGRKELEPAIRAFRTSILEKRPDSGPLGRLLAGAVLGKLSPDVKSKRHWVLSLDGALYDLPFAALPDGAGWLVENHSLRVSPAVLAEGEGERPAITDDFVAVGDPVYNRADSRWTREIPLKPGVELARLPGTDRELKVCSQAWKRDPSPELATGWEVTRERLLKMAWGRPAVLHVAAHVVQNPRSPEQVLVALGMQSSGEPDYLGPADIAVSRTPVGLVTLSGCGSGSGKALPGLGLFGLGRAWLLAGAGAVVASFWPIADDSGELLSAMYEELGRTNGRLTATRVGDALGSAQRRMIRAGGWRADPAYWSAFTVMGKD